MCGSDRSTLTLLGRRRNEKRIGFLSLFSMIAGISAASQERDTRFKPWPLDGRPQKKLAEAHTTARLLFPRTHSRSTGASSFTTPHPRTHARARTRSHRAPCCRSHGGAIRASTAAAAPPSQQRRPHAGPGRCALHSPFIQTLRPFRVGAREPDTQGPSLYRLVFCDSFSAASRPERRSWVRC